MGCTASTTMIEDDENDPFLEIKKANDAIEQSMKIGNQNEKNQIKLLLLGAGESGKSTVLKQLKLLHQGGFTHQERLQYSQVIWADAIQSMKILIIQARKLNIQLDCDNYDQYQDLFKARSILLNTNTLQIIDANVAGGSNFLNDYVLKYSERYETKRRVQSTGKVKALDLNVKKSKSKLKNVDDTLENDDMDDINPLEIVNDIRMDEKNPHSENQTDTKQVNPDNEKISSSEETTLNINEMSKNLNETGNDKMFIKKNISIKNKKHKYTNDEIANAISLLWENDKGIKQCFNRSNEFQLEGSSSYYFDNIKKFADPNYVCTEEDILKGRIKTTGITENEFNIGSSKFKVLDAGGQRSERKKWIHSFQGITAVIFVLATSEYDQMLFEDERVNRMHESIMLFDTLLNSKWFRDTPFILFLNKIDIFEEKVKVSPIRKYFPDYQGRVGDVEAGLQYFEKIFLSLNRSNKPIYVKRTCATDRQSMKFVLSAVTDMIIQQNLKKSGII